LPSPTPSHEKRIDMNNNRSKNLKNASYQIDLASGQTAIGILIEAPPIPHPNRYVADV